MCDSCVGPFRPDMLTCEECHGNTYFLRLLIGIRDSEDPWKEEWMDIEDIETLDWD